MSVCVGWVLSKGHRDATQHHLFVWAAAQQTTNQSLTLFQMQWFRMEGIFISDNHAGHDYLLLMIIKQIPKSFYVQNSAALAVIVLFLDIYYYT